MIIKCDCYISQLHKVYLQDNVEYFGYIITRCSTVTEVLTKSPNIMACIMVFKIGCILVIFGYPEYPEAHQYGTVAQIIHYIIQLLNAYLYY